MESLELYCFSPDAYFDDISEFEKDNCFIESVTPVDALVRALRSANAVVCVDSRSEPLLVLPILQKLVPIRFEKANENQILTPDIKNFN